MSGVNVVGAVQKTAVFAGGCFWCMEPPFQEIPGVSTVVSGYIGGQLDNPTYEQVSAGGTGHAEAIEVTYDPEQVTYEQLLDVYWRNIDPTVDKRQFCDVGDQYRSAIFVADDAQRLAAQKSIDDLTDSGRFTRVYTGIEEASKFYPAEDYHQDYAIKNPVRYNFYKYSCGRDKRLEELWGDE